MDAEKALVEAVAFALGTGVSDPTQIARFITEHLRRSGYSMRSDVPPVMDDMAAETLRRARSDLGLTQRDVAFHAGVKTSTVAKLEAGRSVTENAAPRRITAALVKLGAKLGV